MDLMLGLIMRSESSGGEIPPSPDYDYLLLTGDESPGYEMQDKGEGKIILSGDQQS